ncbi:PilZ domain-containing protein [Erythrobacter sp. SD-21]|uniref:PilZ domain-containing protein n=1 Tax=Erythrobacter sp. SD-21 TaxID=161528 RepID=UPI000A0163C1|nr:PilZ domain-containing protein [Erythrobacter sp. SD-21]
MNTDRRSRERSDTSETVRVEIGGRDIFGTMRNLSQMGCMVETLYGAADLGERCEVSLIPGYSVSGRIAWQLGRAMGIAFSHPVPLALVQEIALDDWPMRVQARTVVPIHR